MTLTVYGIPTCGTVKKARSFVEKHGLAYRYVDLRETPPDAARVRGWVARLGVGPLKNTSGGSYRALGAEKDGWTDERWIQAFAEDPMLIKRPVIERDGAAVMVGFNLPEAELLARLG